MAKRKRGRSTVFSREQNHALRAAMRELGQQFESQSALGRALGIEQQSVARLLRDRRAGFAYATATTVVRLIGFTSVDAFFAKHGVVAAVNDALHRQSA